MERELTTGSTWQHYKRKTTYTIVGVARSQVDENESDMVIYKSTDDNQLWIRPKDRFLEKVDKGQFRFTRLE